MTARTFKTYDAMRSCCGSVSPLKFWCSEGKLANLNATDPNSESEQLEKLEAEGWIIFLGERRSDGKKKRRYFAGKFRPHEYRVLTHDEWLAANPGRQCPAVEYDEGTGKKLVAGRAAPGLRRVNVKKILGPAFQFSGTVGNHVLDLIADGLDSKKAFTENPVKEESPFTENGVQAFTENPVNAITENPVKAITGNPVTSLTVSLTDSLPSSLPPKTGGLAGWIKNNYATMGAPDKASRLKINDLISENGEETVLKALNKFLNRPQGFNDVHRPWSLFLNESEIHIGQVLDEKNEAERKAKEKEIIDANVELQAKADFEFMNSKPASSPGASALEYLEDIETGN